MADIPLHRGSVQVVQEQSRFHDGLASGLDDQKVLRRRLMLEALQHRVLSTDTNADSTVSEYVTVAVELSRLNGEEAYMIAGLFTVAEHESAAILQAPRAVAEWLRADGTFEVIDGTREPAPIQIVETIPGNAVWEIAAVLWEPFDADCVYNEFSAVVSAAQRLLAGD